MTVVIYLTYAQRRRLLEAVKPEFRLFDLDAQEFYIRGLEDIAFKLDPQEIKNASAG